MDFSGNIDYFKQNQCCIGTSIQNSHAIQTHHEIIIRYTKHSMQNTRNQKIIIIKKERR